MDTKEIVGTLKGLGKANILLMFVKRTAERYNRNMGKNIWHVEVGKS